MIKLYTLITQLCTVIALILTWTADQWMSYDLNTVAALNPWIALPAATIFMIVPHALEYLFYEDVPDEPTEDLSCIRLRTKR